MIKKVLAFCCACMLIGPNAAWAISKVGSGVRSEWGATDVSKYDTDGDVFERFSKDLCKDTASDKRNDNKKCMDAVGFYMGVEIVEHGGCFVPVVMSCYHDKGDGRDSHTMYYADGSIECVWLCEGSYFGDGCAKKNSPAVEDAVEAYSMLQDLQMVSKSEHTDFMGFYGKKRSGKTPARDVVLAVVESADNGVKVAPIVLGCLGDNEGTKGKHGHLSDMGPLKGGMTKVLCSQGYQENADKTGCVKINSAGQSGEVVENSSGEYENVTDSLEDMVTLLRSSSDYNDNIHKVVVVGGDNAKTAKIVCKDPTKGLKSVGSYECVDCSDGPMGVHTDVGDTNLYGVCEICNTGQYFNGKTCAEATTLSKSVMQYGNGASANVTLDSQCWQMSDLEEYKKCVSGK